jgi:hypothetical protein
MMKFDDLNPEALEYMRSRLIQTEYFQELDEVDKMCVLNISMDSITLYLEGLYLTMITNNGNSEIH